MLYRCMSYYQAFLILPCIVVDSLAKYKVRNAHHQSQICISFQNIEGIVLMLKCYISITTLAIQAVLLSLVYSYVTSALRLCDSINCDVTLNLVNNAYIMSIPIYIFINNPNLVLCFRPRPIIIGTDSQCVLTGYLDNFTCLAVNIPNIHDSTTIIASYTSDATLTDPNGTKTTQSITALIGSVVLFNISIYTIPSQVYQTVVGYRLDLSNDDRSKSVFFHTFQTDNQNSSDNLFMQRNYQCLQFYYQFSVHFNVVFYGGTLRDSQNTMYFHVVSYLQDNSIPLNIWGAISYSTSHAARDMLGFSSMNGQVYDLYSLYFGAPFQDDDIFHVGSTNDIKSLASSYPYTNKSQFPYYYFMGCSRLYDTSDTLGDQIIFKKMGAFFCYAVAYSDRKAAITPTNPNYKHSYVSCWNPDITVWQNYILVILLQSILLIMFQI